MEVGLSVKFSPREWGWSDAAQLTVSTTRGRFPHASGDGPLNVGGTTPLVGFSPREWGWSVLN